MHVTVRAQPLWGKRVRVLRHAPCGCLPGAVLVLYCCVLALVPGFASPLTLPEQVTQAADEVHRLSRAGQYREAIALMQDVLHWHELALGTAHLDIAVSLSSLADLYRLQGQYSQAEPLYQRALAIREQALGTTHPDVATTLHNLGRLYRDQGQYSQAEPLYQRALAIREQALGTTHPDVATTLHNLGLLYYDQGQYSQAEPLYQRALAIREQALGTTHPDVATTLNNLGLLYYDQGQYSRAEPLYQRALAIREQALGTTHPDVATALNNLGLLYYDQGQYSRAEPLYQRALAIREQALGTTHPRIATTLTNLAVLYRDQGQYSRAEPLYQRALAIREQALGPAHAYVATTLNNLADLYRLQGQYSRAEPLYQRALTIREQALGPAHSRIAITLSSLADLYRLQGQYSRAEPLYQRALTIQEQTFGPTHPHIAITLSSLADLYRLQGQYSRAEPLYQRALTIQEQTFGPTHPYIAIILGNLATLLEQQQETARALPLFERARQIYLTVNHTNADLEEEAHRGLLHQQIQTLRAYAILLAAMARESGPDSPPPSAALAAFVVTEQTRTGTVQRALVQASARTAVTKPGTITLARQLQDLQYRQRAVWKQLSNAYSVPVTARDAPHVASLQHSVQQVDRELADVVARLHHAFPRYAELVAPAPIDVPAVQALLHPDEALVSFFTLPDRVLVWLVRPGQPPVYRDVVIAHQTLQTMVASVRRSLEQGPWRPFDVAQAHALYTLLLAPLRAQLAGVTHLLLVPDDQLLSVPFGVLVTEATGEPYQRLVGLVTQPRRPTTRDLTTYAQIAWLARDYALTTLPSATALRALRQFPRIQGTPREPLLGFGDPVLHGDGERRGGAPMPAVRGAQVSLEALRQLPRLPETRTELLAVATALGADPNQALYLGHRATEPAVQALNAAGRLGEAQVLAFATHALIAGELAGLTQPALVLTPPPTPGDHDDGLLALEDILELSLHPTSWVLLSGCKTAADDGSGEGLSGLARAFFFAGAASLLVSQWSVDDAATRVLIGEIFHRHARTPALRRAEALRQGMLAVMTRAQGKAAYFAHPYAWAPFMLIGEGGRGKP